jgi:adenylosuccinate synthase
LTEDDIAKANSGNEYFAGKVLRKRGAEYGTTTGRARRTGWFDGVVARYSTRVNGLTSIAVTKLDCFSDLKELKLCVAYEIGGKKTKDYPTSLDVLEKAKPVYEAMPGWCCDISGATSFEALPKEAKAYVKRMEELAGVPISILSTGPERSSTMVLKKDELF